MNADETGATWDALARSYETPDQARLLRCAHGVPRSAGPHRRRSGQTHPRPRLRQRGKGDPPSPPRRTRGREVVGIDITKTFIDDVVRRQPPSNTRFLRGDISRLEEIQGLTGRFDIVLLLNGLGYADDELVTLRAIRRLLKDDGIFVLARAHPLRFAVERAESTGVGLGAGYHDRSAFSYRSSWDGRTTLTHRAATGDTVNRLVDAGFWVDRVVEPTLAEEQRRQFPHKQAWMDRYAGTLILRARPRAGE